MSKNKNTNDASHAEELFIEDLNDITGGAPAGAVDCDFPGWSPPPTTSGQTSGLGMDTTRGYGEEDGGYGINSNITNPNQLPSR